MTTENWPDRVRALRAARRETIQDFAHAVGVSISSVWRWENGTTPTGLSRQRLEAMEHEAEGGKA